MITLPDDLPVGVVAVPDLRPVPAAAVSALELTGKDADRALAVPALGAGSHQRLHHLEGLRIDNGLVVVLDVVLRDFTLVGLFLLGQKIYSEGLLQQRITLVLFVGENAFDVAGVPVVLAAGRRNAFFGQRPGNLEWRLALQEHSVDALDQLGLFRVYHEVVVRPHVVAQKSLERNRDLAVCKPLPLAPCAVLGNGPGLFLRQRGHDRQQKFTLAVEGPDVFFFKIDLDVVLLEFPDGSQAIDCVSGKAADRLRDNQVDLAVKGICNHLPELLTLFGIGAGDAFVRIYPDELPIIPAIDVIRVVVNLRFVTGQLLLVVGADTSVGRHTSLLSAVDRCRREA